MIAVYCSCIVQAGEDLEEDEETSEDDTEGPVNGEASETAPLLGHKIVSTVRSRSRSKRRATSPGPHGNATVTQAVLMVRIFYTKYFSLTHRTSYSKLSSELASCSWEELSSTEASSSRLSYSSSSRSSHCTPLSFSYAPSSSCPAVLEISEAHCTAIGCANLFSPRLWCLRWVSAGRI